MNTSSIVLSLVLTAGVVHAQAPVPAPATEPAQTEMQKWIATTDTQWQSAFNRDVVDIHAADLKKLAGQYAVSLDAVLAKASAAGDLDGAVALRNEQKRFTETQVFPEQDDAAEAASVKQIRAATRVQLARIETENAARTKALHAKYDAVLAQAQTQLTQAKRIDDALLVKAKREEVAAAWMTPAVVAATEKVTPAVTPPNPTVGFVKPAAASANFAEHLTALANGRSSTTPLQLEKKETIVTQAKFKPPVEIFVEAKTDSTDLRIGYAADQIIFNWERGKAQFRIDGGPGNKQHKKTGGLIPTNKYVTVRWVVTPKRQAVYVDGQLRFEHHGDYSGIDKPVSVFSGVANAILTVKSIKVKQLPSGTE